MRATLYCWLLLSLSGLAGPPAQAQTLYGTVADDSVRTPLIGVSIVANAGQQATASGARGRFRLALPGRPATTTLAISCLGYASQLLRVAPGAQRDTLRIFLKRSTLLLDEVVVGGQRATMTVEVDRLTVDASRYKGSPAAGADNLLRLVPGVRIGPEGGLAIRGDASIQVLIDGKPSLLAGKQLTDWLRSLPVSAVKQIELQAPGSARLDAEKTGGALNIVLQKQLLDGYRGSLNLGVGTRFNHQGAGSFVLKKGRLNATATAGIYTHPNGGRLLTERAGTTSDGTPYVLLQNGIRTAYDRSLTFGAGLNWEADTTLLLSARLQGDGFKLWSSNDIQYRNFSTNVLTEDFNLHQERNLANNGVSGTFSADKTYQRGRKLVADLLYSYRTETIDNTLYQDEVSQGHDLFHSHKHESAVQLRWEQPLGKAGRLEIGTKEVARLSRSDYPVIAAPGTTDYVQFNQYNAALYGLHNLALGQTKVQYGVRAEYLGSHFQANQEPDYRQSYFNLFPSLAIMRSVGPSLNMRVSYARKTRRPGISYLNAFEDRRDPKNIVVGNTSLLPEFKDVLDLSATLLRKKVTLVTSVYYRRTHGAILSYITPGTDNAVVTTYANAGTEIATGINPTCTLELANLTLNTSLDASYYRATNEALGLSNAGLMAGVNLDAGYRFNKQWFVNITGNYDTRRILLNGTTTGWNTVGMTIQRTIRDKYVLTLRAQDIFNTSHFVNRYYGDSFNYITDYRPTFQALVLSATYRFGKKFTRKEGTSTLRLDDVSEKSNR
jgi:hypothetical protein